VIRLLVTYFLVAGLALFFTHRAIQRLRLGAALFLAAIPVLFLGEAFATNGVYAPLDITYRWEPLASYRKDYRIDPQRTPLLVDVVDQHIPWRKAVREAIKDGRLPLWNRFQLAGEPLLAVQMPQVLYPGTWLGLVLPLAQAWTFDMALRLFIAMLSAFLLLRDMGCGSAAACFGATAWALSDFLIFTIGYPHGCAAGPLPLLVAGLRRIATSSGTRGFGLTTGATALILSAGHPETSLHAVAAAGLFFLVFVFGEPAGRRAPSIRKALLAGVLGVGLMAATILPFLEVLPQTAEYAARRSQFAHARKSVPLPEALVNLENQIVPYSQGISGHSLLAGHQEASTYAGSLVLALTAIGLCIRSRDRLALVVLGTVAILVAVGCPGASDILGHLPLFDIAVNQRLVFVGAFSLIVLSAMGLEALLQGRATKLALTGGVAVAVAIVLIWIERRSTMQQLKMSARYMNERLALEILPLLALLLCVAFARSRTFLVRHAWAFPIVLAGIRYAETGRLYSVTPANAFYPPLAEVAPIPRSQPYRFASLFLSFIPNMSALYELEDVRGYEAMTLRKLVETFPLWCVPQPVSFNRVDDPTRPFLSFLNVRYVLVPVDYGTPPGFHEVTAGQGGKLLQNERALPRAFIPKRVSCSDGRQEIETMQTIADFADAGVATTNCSPSKWIANGAGTVEITSYHPQGMDLAVQAQDPLLLATSVTAWPGWQLRVDGRRQEPVSYNHAFLGIQIPAGAHAVTLRYLPRGFLAGSFVTVLAALGLLLRAASLQRPGS
jgi:hypothetical protein